MSSTPDRTPEPSPDTSPDTTAPLEPARPDADPAGSSADTTPVPAGPAPGPIETLYAAPGARSPSEAPPAPDAVTPVGLAAAPVSPRRWSARRTAAVAGIALALGALGAVGIATALPHDGTASIGDRGFGTSGQVGPGQWPGGPGSAGQGPGGAWDHDSAGAGSAPGWLGGPGRDHDDDGDHVGAGGVGDDGLGQAPDHLGGTGGDLTQLDPNGGATHTT